MADDNQPNLDLINMVQNARMMHDQTARPSDYSSVYWIEAKRQQGDYPAATPNTGEWRITIHMDAVDEIWEKVKQATNEGKLGYKSKVSTRPAAGQTKPEERLLCIRTYNADDAADIERVKQELIHMGMDNNNMDYVRDKAS